MTDSPKLPVVHNGRGRPAYDDAVRKRIIDSLQKLGCTRSAAYGEAGISEATFYRWMSEDDSFREAVVKAEAAAHRLYTARLTKRAAAGDTKAITFWLERRHPTVWRERVSVDEGPPSLEDVINEALDDDKLAERLRALQAEAAEALDGRDRSRDAGDDPGDAAAGGPAVAD